MNFGLNSLSGGLSLARILGTLSRTIGIVRQISPIYKDIKPLLSKAPLLLERINGVRMMNYGIKNYVSNEEIDQFEKINGPTFFQ